MKTDQLFKFESHKMHKINCIVCSTIRICNSIRNFHRPPPVNSFKWFNTNFFNGVKNKNKTMKKEKKNEYYWFTMRWHWDTYLFFVGAWAGQRKQKQQNYLQTVKMWKYDFACLIYCLNTYSIWFLLTLTTTTKTTKLILFNYSVLRFSFSWD